MKREKGKERNENISQSSGSKPPKGPREAYLFFFLGLAPKRDVPISTGTHGYLYSTCAAQDGMITVRYSSTGSRPLMQPRIHIQNPSYRITYHDRLSSCA